MRALPYAYRGVTAEDGAVVAVEVLGEAGGRWFVRRGSGGWAQSSHEDPPYRATVTLPQSVAWKVFTKWWQPGAVRARFPEIRLSGDEALGEAVLAMTAVMA